MTPNIVLALRCTDEQPAGDRLVKLFKQIHPDVRIADIRIAGGPKRRNVGLVQDEILLHITKLGTDRIAFLLLIDEVTCTFYKGWASDGNLLMIREYVGDLISNLPIINFSVDGQSLIQFWGDVEEYKGLLKALVVLSGGAIMKDDLGCLLANLGLNVLDDQDYLPILTQLIVNLELRIHSDDGSICLPSLVKLDQTDATATR